MKQNYLKALGLSAIPLLTLTGCFDDNYDLDDIDTTSRITVNDLDVSLNLKEILLDNIVELDDNENITKVLIDGQQYYAIEKSGTVSSSDVSINPIKVSAPSISPTSITLHGVPSVNLRSKRVSQEILDKLTINYAIHSAMASTFSFQATDIDDALVSIREVRSVDPISMSLRLELPQALADMTGKVVFNDILINLPKGLYLDGRPAQVSLGSGSTADVAYDPATGTLTVNGEVKLQGRAVVLDIQANTLNTVEAGVGIVNHAINYTGTVGLAAQGAIELTPNGELHLPTSFDFEGRYSLSSFYVADFTGTVNYAIKNIDIAPISLSDLPDFLNDPQTNILVRNPQIYFSADNTTAQYHTGLSGQMALNSTFKDGGHSQADSPEFTIGWSRTPVTIAMAPRTDELNLLSSFPNPERYTFASLSNILTSEGQNSGLPKRINVSLNGLRFHGDAVRFPVRHNWNTTEGTIPALTGNYTFFAPLAFDAGSQIIYNYTTDSFGTEDLDKLHVTSMILRAHAVSNLPLTASVTLSPLDAEGNRVGYCEQALILPADSDKDILLIVKAREGETINHLDRIEIVATISSTGASEALSPNQTIKLTDLRLTVDGYYETDF